MNEQTIAQTVGPTYKTLETANVYKEPITDWHWPNFLQAELCSRDGSLMAWTETLDAMEAMRELLGGPLIVNSFYRNPHHNNAVGGGQKSQHLTGRAVDLRSTRYGTYRMFEIALELGARGLGLYDNFLHMDFRPPTVLRPGQQFAFWDYRTLR